MSDLWDYSEAVIVNCVIWGNTDPQIQISNGADQYTSILRVGYSDLEDGRDSIRIVEGGRVEWSDGNINDNPGFADPDQGDYRLSGNSPCIDAGAAFFVAGEDTILDLNRDQFLGDAPDMGAFDFRFYRPIPIRSTRQR